MMGWWCALRDCVMRFQRITPNISATNKPMAMNVAMSDGESLKVKRFDVESLLVPLVGVAE